MVARIGFDALFSPGTMDGSIKQKSFRLKYINWDVYSEFVSHPDPHYFRFADADLLQFNFADSDPH